MDPSLSVRPCPVRGDCRRRAGGRSTDADDIVAALAGLDVDTVVGEFAWGKDSAVPPYIAKTPLTGGQWRMSDDGEIPVRPGGRVQARPPGAGGRQGRAPLVTEFLEVTGIAKRFGRVVTATDVSFHVSAGEVLGVVGPNGAGKSTMLDIVNGTQRPDSGRVLLDGDDVTSIGAAGRSRRGIGRTYQIPRPFGGLTVFENVLVGATFSGGQRGRQAQHAALDAIETAGLTHVINTDAASLRLLDRKRLELARALATGPRLILLDEIAGGLTEAEVLELVGPHRAAPCTRGLAVVWIEHIVHALLPGGRPVMCLAIGRKVIARRPAHGDGQPGRHGGLPRSRRRGR